MPACIANMAQNSTENAPAGPPSGPVSPPETDHFLTGLPLYLAFVAQCLTSSLITLYVMIMATVRILTTSSLYQG